ncbi:hypothetical protein FQP90_17295 [Paenarthrobacter nitroguajacolicus]|uniref:Uncharacterized protein n=1 Tax=Paenarthrobacter nitroguajacolicus TaxID=211146 RepID=A0A558GTJ2_PAENT|nr:hypothetical protein FQP90_17295 [Paenarthrobacter nitroguajacolicus]
MPFNAVAGVGGHQASFEDEQGFANAADRTPKTIPWAVKTGSCADRSAGWIRNPSGRADLFHRCFL